MENFSIKLVLYFLAISFFGTFQKTSAQSPQSGSAVYAGGPMYQNRDYSINEMRNSGFTTLVVWTIHIDGNGNLNFNAEFPLVTDGVYVGGAKYPNFASDMALLKTIPSTISRLEFGLSAAQSPTFSNIRSLVNSEGTGVNSKLYKNFKALKDAIPSIDAFNFDDESTYDVPSATTFAVMLADLGYKITLCPYNNSSFWQGVANNTNSQRPGTVDLVMLQCYDGGSANSPCGWNFGNIPVWPGLWSRDKNPSAVQSQMASWKNNCGAKGGFMWLYDEFKNSPNTAAYANAINNAFGIIPSPPPPANNPYPPVNMTNTSITQTLSWTAGNGALSHKVYFGTTNNPSLASTTTSTTYNPGTLLPNTTYYWRVDEMNSMGTTTGTLWSFTTGTSSYTRIDRTDAGGTITARGENTSAGEGKDKAFDNSSGTKWLDNSANSWIQFQFANNNAYAITEYTITSANDASERDPKSWELKGSQDGTTWVTLDSRSNIAFTSRYQKQNFSFSNGTAYKYYKFDNIANNSGTILQVAEIELIELYTTILPGVATYTTPANATTLSENTVTLGWNTGSNALSHDVYFGTTNPPSLVGNQTATTYNPGNLAFNTTYYWKVNERNSSGATNGDVWSFTTPTPPMPGAVNSVTPSNGALQQSPATKLSWTAAQYATSYDVYFGTNNPPAFKGNQTGSTYDPGTLAINTKYYWRVDAKNSTGTTAGSVSNFTTASGVFVKTDRADQTGLITARGENNASGEGRDKAFDGSSSTKWLDFSNTSWIQYQFANNNAYAIIEYSITSANDAPERDPKNWTLKGSNDGINYVTLDTQSNIAFTARFQKKNFVINNTTAYKYYKFDNITNNSGNIIQLAEIELFENALVTAPAQATNPTPATNAQGIASAITLTWTPSSTATSHDIYFGSTTTPTFVANQTGSTYNVTGLQPGVTYYWRVDEKNAAGTTTGTVWSFTTSNNINIALNKPVTVSSVESGTSFTGNLAVDGNSSTRWSSVSADPQWISIDLQNTYQINRVVLKWEAAYGKNYRIDISNDGNTWTTLSTINNNTQLTNENTGLNGTARFVRIYGTARGTTYGYSLYEVEVYGSLLNTQAKSSDKADAQTTVAKNSLKDASQDYVEIYPNPADSVFYLNISLKQESDINVAVYNLSGMRIKDLNLGKISSGNTKKEINTDNLVNGVYLVIIKGDHFSISKKLMVRK